MMERVGESDFLAGLNGQLPLLDRYPLETREPCCKASLVAGCAGGKRKRGRELEGDHVGSERRGRRGGILGTESGNPRLDQGANLLNR